VNNCLQAGPRFALAFHAVLCTLAALPIPMHNCLCPEPAGGQSCPPLQNACTGAQNLCLSFLQTTATRYCLLPVAQQQPCIVAKACKKSWTRSLLSSIPHATRTIPSQIPWAALCSGVSPECDVRQGRVTSVSTPPRLGATVATCAGAGQGHSGQRLRVLCFLKLVY
jgi:hypothetical protein